MIQKGLFGESYGVGGHNISELIRDSIDKGYEPDVARAIAFWKFEPVKTLLLQIEESASDELDELLVMWSKNNHPVFETIARSKRMYMEDAIKNAQKPSKYHKRWLIAYYATQHWQEIKDTAAEHHDDPERCINCRGRREAWHHPTYEHIGSIDDARVIIPICSTCHSVIHAVNRKLTPGTIPDRIRVILDREEA